MFYTVYYEVIMGTKFQIQHTVDGKQLKRFKKWCKAQNKLAIIIEKRTEENPSWQYTTCWARGRSLGGQLTYKLTPNSVGMNISVYHTLTGNEINITDLDSW